MRAFYGAPVITAVVAFVATTLAAASPPRRALQQLPLAGALAENDAANLVGVALSVFGAALEAGHDQGRFGEVAARPTTFGPNCSPGSPCRYAVEGVAADAARDVPVGISALDDALRQWHRSRPVFQRNLTAVASHAETAPAPAPLDETGGPPGSGLDELLRLGDPARTP